jgi:PAS domain-containing protein
MHMLASIVANLAAPPVSAATALSQVLSANSHRAPAQDHFAIAAFAVSAGIIGLMCSYWAAWMHARLGNFRLAAKAEHEHADQAIRLRDALLAGGREAVLVFGSAAESPFCVGGANALLQAGMEGPDAKRLAAALDDLLKSGTPFRMSARTAASDVIAIRGTAIGHRAAVFLRERRAAERNLDFRAALDAIPVPVWIRGDDLTLRWANRAFLEATAASNLQDALSCNATIERSEFDLAAAARDGAERVDARRYILIAGKRRALSLSLMPLSGASVAGIAMDMTDADQALAKLRLNADATADMLDGLPTAVTVFDKDQRLLGCNTAYRQMWRFDAQWLETHPTLGEIVDWLRETRQLPEQSDFHAWKREHVELFEDGKREMEEFWHLPGGRSIRVVAKPHLLGGIVMIFEDVSEKLRLETSFNLLAQVQRATLDAVDEAIAIFGPDGRLVLHNRTFAELWQLTGEELSDQPHFTRVAALSEARVGHDGIWSIVSVGLTSSEPERCNEWGKATRADGRTIALVMTRLPNGATMAAFSDLTEMGRFRALESHASHASR